MNADLTAHPTATASTPATEWEVDLAHSTVQFSVKHMMVSTVRGHFQKAVASIHIDERDLTRSRLDVVIDASSIDTREPKRDAHLRSEDFFDVAKYPEITFRSTRVVSAGDGYAVEGALSMHGMTKPLTLAVAEVTAAARDPYGRLVRGASATAKLNRKDWGLGWNSVLETGGVLVGETVTLQIDVELTLKAALPQA